MTFNTHLISDLSMYQILFCASILSIAYIVRGIAGFGSGLIAIPLLSFIFPLSVIVPIIVMLDYLASLSHSFEQKSSIQWKEILVILPFSLMGVVIGISIFNFIDTRLLIQIFGVFIIVFAIYTLLQITLQNNAKKLWAVPTGIMGGLIGTIFGTGGPFYAIYLHLRGLNKNQFKGSFAAIFLIDGSARLIGYFTSSFYSSNTITLLVLSLPIMLISLIIGGKIHTNISQQTFKNTISFLLIFCGIALIIRA